MAFCNFRHGASAKEIDMNIRKRFPRILQNLHPAESPNFWEQENPLIFTYLNISGVFTSLTIYILIRYSIIQQFFLLLAACYICHFVVYKPVSCIFMKFKTIKERFRALDKS